MTHANKGDVVKVHYTGKLENGNVFGNTPEDNPRRVRLVEFEGWAKKYLWPTDQVVLEASTNAWYVHVRRLTTA